MRSTAGYTFIEATLSIITLAIMALSISGLYSMGVRLQDAETSESERARALRSRMEYLLAIPFDNLASGSTTETWDGTSHTIEWTVTPVDMNGDNVVEDNAKTLQVTIEDRSLTTLVIKRRFTGPM